jgi:4-amino-4-deoxy-L-arabinose transferase-like glycosyltransferase
VPHSDAVNRPTPAIVAQDAVRRLPRVALWLFCLAYLLPGWIGREPWKSLDMGAFGYMLALTQAGSDWWHPRLLGLPPEIDALLPYWLGAWFIQLSPGWIDPALAARIPFILLSALTLAGTWYGVYYLARAEQAQPVAFAFGGEASPKDYARALADAGLLALIACLGLTRMSHEITPLLAQLACVSLVFYGVAVVVAHPGRSQLAFAAGLAGLTLSGAPSFALMLGLGSVLLCSLDPEVRQRRALWGLLVICVLSALLATTLDLWRWRLAGLPQEAAAWRSLLRLMMWFTWPTWPLALWTIWRWRGHWTTLRWSRHVMIPLWFAALALVTSVMTGSPDRTLLLALPALATLAAFALPTLRRSVKALIDWFTLLFFSGCAIVIWVVWLSMQTGWPAQPAANVTRLVPGFEPSFGPLACIVALLATVVWCWLVRWRVGRHRAALWKSLVLPAAGAALCWMLLMTLWLPLLDFARSYAPLVRNVVSLMGPTDCVQVHGLTPGQLAAFRYHGHLRLEPLVPATRQAGESAPHCAWLIVDSDSLSTLHDSPLLLPWTRVQTVRRPSDDNEDVVLWRRTPRAAGALSEPAASASRP